MVLANIPLAPNFRFLVNGGVISDFLLEDNSYVLPGPGNIFLSNSQFEYVIGAGIRVYNQVALVGRYSAGSMKAHQDHGIFQTSNASLILCFQFKNPGRIVNFRPTRMGLPLPGPNWQFRWLKRSWES